MPPRKKKAAPVKFKVTGNHSIDGVEPGGVVEFAPDDLSRARGLERAGAIAKEVTP